MRIVVRLAPHIARVFHEPPDMRSDPAPAARDLLETLERYGADLRPMHPGVADPELAAFFLVEGAEEDDLVRLRDALAALEAVAAAYVKPPPAMP